MTKLMTYDTFYNIFNETIFESSKRGLLEKVAKYPNRYIGLFRPTRPEAKLLQNLLQSHEIRFGDAFEEVIEEYCKLLGYEILDKNLKYYNKPLKLDQLIYNEKSQKLYFIEQKIRDDHDSSKKEGQIKNFEKKLSILINKYDENKIVAFFYFIDPSLNKNINYYREELNELSKAYGVEIYLMYGKELFQYLEEPKVWDEIIDHLKVWKKQIPEIPEINFDLNSKESFEEIKDMEPSIFRKLFSNEEVFEQIIPVIFPEGKTLRYLLTHFQKLSAEKKIYETLADMLEKKNIKNLSEKLPMKNLS